MDSTKDTAGPASYVDIMEKNHMEIPWHDYAKADSNVLIENAGLIEKASVIGRVGLMMLSCGTGAWRVRTSMNRLSKELGVTCTVDVGLMSIEFNCFDGTDCVSQSYKQLPIPGSIDVKAVPHGTVCLNVFRKKKRI